MLTLFLVVHVITAVVMVLVVLLQSGRGAELGAAFGGLGQVTYGSSQPSIITRITVVLAVIFMSTSVTLAIFYQDQPSSSVVDELSPKDADAAQDTETSSEPKIRVKSSTDAAAKPSKDEKPAPVAPSPP